MDSFFGIGLPELAVVLILAGIVMGPRRMGEVARWLGKTTAQLQAISRGFMRQLTRELDAADEQGELKAALEDVRDLRRQVTELRNELGSATKGALYEGDQAIRESKSALENTIRPPAFKRASKSPEESAVDNGQAPEADDTAAPELPRLKPVPDDPE